MTDTAHKPFYMAFDHRDYKVNTHESIVTGETVTIVKWPTTMQAFMQLRQLVKEIEESLNGE